MVVPDIPSPALAAFEFFLLFEHELFVLRRKWTGVTWLFLVNRYLTIAFVITMIAPYAPNVSSLLSHRYLTYLLIVMIPDVSARSLNSDD